MRGVAENGKVRFIEVPKKTAVRLLADNVIKHLDGVSMTKTEVALNFKITRALATAAVHELESMGAIRWTQRLPAAGWAEPVFTVCAPRQAVKTAPRETPAEAAHRRKMDGLFRRHGQGVCTRCGGPAPGKSQVNRHKRGHTDRLCDAQLVRLIQES